MVGKKGRKTPPLFAAAKVGKIIHNVKSFFFVCYSLQRFHNDLTIKLLKWVILGEIFWDRKMDDFGVYTAL